jgi:DNA-binding NtrC family response regulator
MNKSLRVLIVEDSENDTLLLVRELQRGGYDPIFKRVETPETMKAALEKQTWDIVIADYVMPHFSGLDALRVLKESKLDLPLIIVSGSIGEDIAVAALKAGGSLEFAPSTKTSLNANRQKKRWPPFKNNFVSRRRWRPLVVWLVVLPTISTTF